ncbi:helix-turn-helix domain-containing protein [Devosia sp. LjRoot3]|uniref:helix-turn-helix domain-containing protein n=1 Tax=Devosia sp. LjRoot3 TaxID=3342319 RepID=UPI003ECFDCE9
MQGPVPPVPELGQTKSYQPTSRQLLRALETMAGVGFFTLSFADGKVRPSDGLLVLAGTLDQVGQPIGIEFIEARTHPDDRASLIESFHMLMRDTLPTRRDLRILREDGTERRLEMRFERMADEARRPVGWIICVLDRTEEESLKKNLVLMRQRLRAVLERLDVDLAWFSSPNGRVIERVKQSENAHLPDTSLFTLDSWFSSVHPDDRAQVLAGLDHPGQSVTEARVERAPGQYVPMRTVRQPVLNETGETIEWLGLTTLVEPGRGGLEANAAASEELLNGPLLRAARNLLGWTIPVLAEQSGVSASTIMRIEEATAPVIEVARRRTAERLTQALTKGGVTFHRTLTGKLAISL